MKALVWLSCFKKSGSGWNGPAGQKAIITRGKLGLLLLLAVAFGSCEENMWLRSEKKIRSQIQGTWDRIELSANGTRDEVWTIKDGVVVILETEKKNNNKDDGFKDLNILDLDTLVLDIGNYSVDAKLDNAYIRLSNLEKGVVESAKQGLNAKWTIVDIDNHILFIAAENGSAVIQREFEKR